MVRRAPTQSPTVFTTPPTLTPGQQAAADGLRRLLDSGETQTVLLFGVTASGKTEVYLNAIAHTLAQGRSAIVLVPEIALTGQIVDVFMARFGEQVAVLHSKLSEGERHDEWRRMQAGKARIVVGARSAIFAPVQNVGLIVMDEEHEASYKQENTPRYNAKDLAFERARLSKATLVLGSATPSLESYFACENAKRGRGGEGERGRKDGEQRTIRQHTTVAEPSPAIPLSPSPPHLLKMPDRIDNRPLPRVHVVDLREEFKQRQGAVLAAACRGHDGAVSQEAADHSVSQPAGLRAVRAVPGLRLDGKMPQLRRVAGLSRLRPDAENATTATLRAARPWSAPTAAA